MNHIRFMLNRINDYSLLHEKKEELDHELFGENTTVTVDCDHTKEYCQSIIGDVTTAIAEIMNMEEKAICVMGASQKMINEG